MIKSKPIRIKTISEFHKLRGLPKPEHPLISIMKMEEITIPPGSNETSIVFDFYFISLKRVQNATYKYGQNNYDFSEGTLFFMAPNQVLGKIACIAWICFLQSTFCDLGMSAGFTTRHSMPRGVNCRCIQQPNLPA